MSDAHVLQTPVRTYDLGTERDPVQAHRAQFDALFEQVNDRFCRQLRAALQQRLGRSVEIAARDIEVVKHGDLIDGLTAPSHLTLVTLRPLPGVVMVACDVQLVVTFVESSFGGSGRFPIRKTGQEFSPFEQKSMRRVIETMLAQLVNAWEPLCRLEVEIVRNEINPAFAAFAASGETMVLNTYEIAIEHGSGRLRIALPFASLLPLLEQPSVGTAAVPVDRDQQWALSLQDSVADAPIALNVELGFIEISVAELMALQPGNIFEMRRPDTVTVVSNGVPLFRGRWGSYKGKVAVSVEDCLSSPAGLVA